MNRDNGGFALFAVVIMVALLMTSAVTLVTTDLAVQDKARIDGAKRSLEALDTAAARFRGHVEMYPLYLQHLSAAVLQSDSNSCGQRYGAAAANKWSGPYLQRVVSSTGLPTGVGVAESRLVRSAKGNNADLYLNVTSVRESDALRLDEQIDASNGRTSGKLRWDQPNQDGITTARYYLQQGTNVC